MMMFLPWSNLLGTLKECGSIWPWVKSARFKSADSLPGSSRRIYFNIVDLCRILPYKTEFLEMSNQAYFYANFWFCTRTFPCWGF